MRRQAAHRAAALLVAIVVAANLAVGLSSCPSGTSSKAVTAHMTGGHCRVCGASYGCGPRYINYRSTSFSDPVPAGNKVVKIYSNAYGALNCGSARAEVRVNGVAVGSHAQTGNCACNSCWTSSKMERSNDAGYNYRGTNTITYHLTSGNYMCTSKVVLHLCHKQDDCPAGQYGGGGSCTVCPKGTYRDTRGAKTAADCYDCPAGTFGSSTGLTSSACSGQCAKGHYCPARSTVSSAVDCPAGTYGDTTGLKTSSCTGLCDPGSYCPAGSTTSAPAKCAGGRYGSSGQSSSLCSGPCLAGYYCPSGSSRPDQVACGGSSSYCPAGSASAQPVSNGYYSNGGQDSSHRTAQTICPKGSYCLNGIQYSCPAGSFGETTGISTSVCSGECKEGYYCPPGSTRVDQEPCGTGSTPAKYYCPAGSSSRKTVPSGSYSVPEDGSVYHRTGQLACGTGYTCANGIRTPSIAFNNCPNGATIRSAPEGITNQPFGDALSASSQSGSVAFSIMSVNPSPMSLFSINPSTGKLSTGSTALNYKVSTSHVVVVRATAGSDTIDCAVTVNVADVNEAPLLTPGQVREVEEGSAVNTNVGEPIEAIDGDGGQSLSFSIVGGDGQGVFSVSTCSGQLQVEQAGLNYNTKSSYSLQIKVEDDGSPPQSTTGTVTVNLINTNDPPVMSDATFTVAENSPVGTAVGTMTASDADGEALSFSLIRDGSGAFTINAGTGQITVKENKIDYELQRQYILRVRVTDASTKFVEADAVVDVQDGNDPPKMEAASRFVDENSAVGTLVGAPMVATDVDAGQTVSFSLATNDDGKFQVASNGQISVAATGLNYEAKNVYNIVVRATDSGGASSTAPVTIYLVNVNEQPTLSDSTMSVAENSPVDTLVGTVVGNDVDAGQTLSYYITAGADGVFSIGRLSGDVRVAGAINFEAKNQYTLTVQVQDNGSPMKSTTATVTVSVTNVNEPPVVNQVTLSVPENTADGTNVGSPVTATDPDAGDQASLTFTILSGNTGDAFTMTSTGQLKVGDSQILNYEYTSQIKLIVQAEDPHGATGTGTITVDVTDVNEAPTWVMEQLGATSLSRAVPERATTGTTVGAPVQAQDEDRDQTVTFSIVGGNSAGFFKFDPPTDGQLRVAKNMGSISETGGSFTLTLRATDSYDPSKSSDVTCRVSVTDSNDPPQIDSTFARSVPENSETGTAVGAPVTGSDEDTGQSLSYSFSGGNQENAFEIDSSTGPIRVGRPVLDYETQNQYVLLVDVKDSGSPPLSSTAQVTVSLTNVNEPPTLSDAAVSVGENTAAGTLVEPKLQGSDPDAGQTALLKYTITGGNSAGVFEIVESTGQVKVAKSMSLNYETQNLYVLSVRVTDPGGLTDDAKVEVNVLNRNDPPVFTARTYTVGVREDVVAGSTIGNVGASDEDGDVLAFSITSVTPSSGSDKFTLDSATGALTLAKAVNFEAVSSYTVALSVSDSHGGVDTATLAVNVVNVNEAPSVTGPYTASVAEDVAVTSVVARIQGSDPDAGDRVTWSISAGNVGGAFTVHPNDGTLSTAAGLDYETRRSYTLTLVATDTGGLTGSAVVVVTVTDVNEPPQFLPTSRTVRENSPVGTQVGAALEAVDEGGVTTGMTFEIVGGNVGGAFRIDGQQVVVAEDVLNYEALSSYSLLVRVTDSGSPPLSVTATVTVTVLDVNERPSITGGTRRVDENSPTDTVIGSPIQASDPDIGQMLTFRISAGNDQGLFKVNPCSGQLQVSVPALNYEAVSSYELTVQVTDDGADPPRLTASATVRVEVNDVNEAPVIADAAREVPENSAPGTAVGAVVTGTDVDFNQTARLQYSIDSGNDDGAFAMEAGTGQIRVVRDVLNFEARSSYTLVVKATDPGGLWDTAKVTVTVTDVNEAPVFTGSLERSVAENSLATTLVGAPLTARDVDAGQTVSFAVVGGDGAALFTLGGSTGQLEVADGAVLDYETKNAYSVVVEARDDASPSLATNATVVVRLLDVNEAPVLADVTRSVEENSPVGAPVGAPVTGSDVDAGQVLSYEVVAQSVPDVFRVDSATGQLEVRTASLDFEGVNSYSVTLRVRDSGEGRLSDTATVTVNVEDVNEPPVVLAAERSVAENSGSGTLVGARLTFSDPDGNPTTLRLTNASNPDSIFSVGSSGQIFVQRNVLNYEAVNRYDLVVEVSDGVLQSTAPVTVRVLDVNEAPVLLNQTRAVGETAARGALVGSRLVVTDPDVGQTHTFAFTDAGRVGGRFALSADGQLSVADVALSHATTPSYEVQVTVTDSGGSRLTDTAWVTILVFEENEAPVVGNYRFSVPENSAVGVSVGSPVTATDPDSDPLTYSLKGGNVDGVFRIDSGTGQLRVAVAALDFETRPLYTLTVEVRDDGDGNPDNEMTASSTVVVQLEDVNEAPTLADSLRGVDENSPVGTLVGAPVRGSDVDANQTLAYSIVAGNGEGLFALDAATGQLSVARAALDYERQSTYALRLRATDDGVPSLWAEGNVTVNVGNVNDRPTLARRQISVKENLAVGDQVGTAVTGSDQDSSQRLSYTITGGLCFAVDSDGSKAYAELPFALASAGRASVRLSVRASSSVFVALATSEAALTAQNGEGYEVEVGADGNAATVVRRCVNCEAEAARAATAGVVSGSAFRELWVEVAGNGSVRVGTGAGPGAAGAQELVSWVDASPLAVSRVAVTTGGLEAGTIRSVCYDGAAADARDTFRLDSATGQLYVARATLNFEAQARYGMEVTVRDDGPGTLSDVAVVEVLLTDVNEVPLFEVQCLSSTNNTVTALCPEVPENSPAQIRVGSPLVARDPDAGQTLRFSLTSGNVGGAFVLDAATGQLSLAKAVLNHEDPVTGGVYELGVSVRDDGAPELSSSGLVRVTVTDVNEAPTMQAFQRSVPENSGARTLVGVRFGGAAHDVDDGAFGRLTFSIVGGSGAALFGLDPDTNDQLVVASGAVLNYEAVSQYTVEVEVADGGSPSLKARATATVLVTDVNEAPTLLDAVFTVEENSAVGVKVGTPLNGTDPDFGQTLLYAVTGGNGGDVLGVGACSGQVEVRAATLDFETQSRYVLVVTVTDDGTPRLSDTAVVNVTVLDVNEAPVLQGAAFTVDENSPVGTAVGAPLVATDVDRGQTLTYELVAGNTGGVFAVDAATGQVSVAVDALDFERRAEYTLTARVTDDGVPALSATAVVVVTLRDVNEVPVYAAATRSVEENSAVDALVGTPVTGSDVDAGQTLSYSIVGGNEGGVFKMEPGTGQVRVASAVLNYEAQSVYVLQVRATDDGVPSLFANATLTVQLADVNEAPHIAAGARSVKENSPSGTVIGAPLVASDPDFGQTLTLSIVGGNDGGVFTLDALNRTAAELRVLQPSLNYEARTSYTLQVQVQDSGKGNLVDTALYTVSVLNVNEAPRMGTYTRTVAENSPGGRPLLGGAVTGTDPDAGDVLRYSVAGGDGAESFTVTAATGEVFVADGAALNYEAKPVYTLLVNATDKGGLSATGVVTVQLLNVNEPPSLADAEFQLGERSTPGTTVGSPLAATDPDVGDTHTYAIVGGNAAGTFRFSSSKPGQLEVAKTTAELEYPNLLTLEVRATDSGQLSATAYVQVNMTNRNFPPVLNNTVMRVAENSAVGTVVGTLVGSDPDSDQTLSYRLVTSEPSKGLDIFRVDAATGEVLVAEARVNFEDTSVFSLTVQAQDNGEGRLTDSATVTVRVLDVNEPPSISAAARSVAENSGAGTPVGPALAASDPDAADVGALRLSMRLASGGGEGPFQVDAVSGQVSVRSPTPVLDYEGVNTFTYNVTVTDHGGLQAWALVTVSLVNVNEAPTVEAASFRVAENSAATTLVGVVSAADPDAGTTLRFAITAGNEGGAFGVDGSGAVRVASPVLDFEDRDAYVLTVAVTDDGIPGARAATLSRSATVRVAVEDLKDVTLSGFSGAVLHGTAGGQDVVLHGTNFGPTARKGGNTSVVAYYQPASNALATYVARNCRVSTKNTRVTCETVPGVGAGLRWFVHVVSGNASASSGTVYTAYVPPAITGVTGAASLRTSGGETVRLQGSNLGPNGTFVTVTYGPTGSEYTAEGCFVSVPHGEVECRSVEGVGGSLVWRVRVGKQWSGTFASGGYAAPSVAAINGTRLMQTRGGEVVELIGANFGRVDPVRVTYGPVNGTAYTAVGCRVVAAHGVIRCMSAPGVGADNVWVVRVGGQTSAASTATTSYLAPTLVGVSIHGAPELVTEGGQTVVLRGVQLGPRDSRFPPLVRYGRDASEFTALDCFVSTPHTVVTCTSAAGTGANHSWVVSVGQQSSPVFAAGTRYAAPIVALYSGAGAADADTRGGQLVRVEGRQFGTVARNAVQSVTYKRADSEATFTATGCAVTVDHVEITCTTTEGAGSELSWTVVVDGQESRNPTTDYAAPTVTGFGGEGAANASTDGGQEVAIYGKDFGPASAPGPFLQRVTYGPSGAEYLARDCAVVGHTEVRCRLAPGVGDAMRWIVEVEGQASAPSTATTSYAAPQLLTVEPASASTTGGDEITVTGTDFGLKDPTSDVTVVFDGQALLPTAKQPAGPVHVLKFIVPEGQGTEKPVHVSVSSVAGVSRVSEPVMFSYSPPVITEINTEEGPTSSTMRLLLFGNHFGTSGRVLVDGVEVSVEQVDGRPNWDHTFVAAVYEGEQGAVQVETGGQTSNTREFRFFSPFIVPFASTDPRLGLRYATRGGGALELSVRYFGTTSNITVGGLPCPVTSLTADNADPDLAHIVCRVPPGAGAEVPVVVHRGAQPSLPMNPGLSYSVPSVFSTVPSSSPMRLPTAGGQVLLVGDDFPPAFIAPTVTMAVYDHVGASFSQVPCQVLSWNYTHVAFEVPVGEGENHNFLLLAAGQAQAESLPFAYNKPEITSVVPAHGPTQGLHITLYGRNFGVRPPTVYLGNRVLRVVSGGLQGNGSVVVEVPEGQGVNLPLILSVGNQNSSSAPFSYDAPEILGVDPSPAHGPTAGGANVTVFGRNFGLNGTVYIYGSTGAVASGSVPEDRATVVVPASMVVEYNHTAIRFRLPEGQGMDRTLRVQVLSRQSNAIGFEYDSPNVTAVLPAHGSTDGGYVLRLQGRSLGTAGARVFVRHELPGQSQECTAERGRSTLRQSHDEIACVVPDGIGAKLVVETYVGARRANDVLFSYDPPEITAIIPNVPDAQGEEIVINGRNFGSAPSDVQIHIGGLPCERASWARDASSFFKPYLKCMVPRDVVGWKNVSVAVAGQVKVWNVTERLFRTECKKDFYGQVGEYCLSCPEGANCTGKLAEPVSLWGFFDVKVENTDPLCPAERRHREECVHVVACLPDKSCWGNNTCATGYTDVRCTECVIPGFYRLGGECAKCPDQPWLLLVGFGSALVVLMIAAYVLHKKNVHLAFMTIGVDYFQVLAVFANSNVPWPPMLAKMFWLMSMFNFNLELTAPECTFNGVGFRDKWYFMESLPILATTLFTVLVIGRWFYMRCIRGMRRESLSDALGGLSGLVLTMFYYLYLAMTRMTLNIFNCTPTDPPDGHEYMQAVPERCWEAGGLHMELAYPAMATLAMYTLGYPLVVSFVLWKFRELMQEDQYLRAKGQGEDLLTNPRAFHVRMRYRKLYYHFKPRAWWWMLMILFRKFWIAFTALMFRSNAAFQLSVALVGLFSSYVMQVKYRPYMSMSERPLVLKDLEARVEKRHEDAVLGKGKTGSLEERISRRLSSVRVPRSKNASLGQTASLSGRARSAQAFFWNYNTVESILLACSIFVNLSGIMFVSGQFENADQITQRDLLTYLVITVIMVSIIYFAAVTVSEVVGTCAPQFLAKRIQRRQRKKLRRDADVAREKAVQELARMHGDGGDEGGGYGVSPEAMAEAKNELAVNPMFLEASAAAALGKDVASGSSDGSAASYALPQESAVRGWTVERCRAEILRMGTAMSKMQEQNTALVEEVRESKKRQAMGVSAASGASPLARAAGAAGSPLSPVLRSRRTSSATSGQGLGRMVGRGRKGLSTGKQPFASLPSPLASPSARGAAPAAAPAAGDGGSAASSSPSPLAAGGRIRRARRKSVSAGIGGGSALRREDSVQSMVSPSSSLEDGAAPEPPSAAAAESVWQPVVNPEDGRIYYVNVETMETRWDKPEE